MLFLGLSDQIYNAFANFSFSLVVKFFESIFKSLMFIFVDDFVLYRVLKYESFCIFCCGQLPFLLAFSD